VALPLCYDDDRKEDVKVDNATREEHDHHQQQQR